MPAAIAPVLNAILGFLPWITYWALIGSVSFRVAISVAVLISLAVTFGRRSRRTGFEVGSSVALLILLAVSFLTDGRLLQQWIQPVTTGSLFVVATILQFTGRPFTLPYAEAAVDEQTRGLDGFVWINRMMSAAWCVTFALMTAISAIPPIVQGAAAATSGGSTLSIFCYWVFPFALAGLTGVLCGVFPGWFTSRLAQASEPLVPPAGTPPAVPADGVRFTGGQVDVAGDPDRFRIGVVDENDCWWWSPWRDEAREVEVSAELATARPDGVREPDVFVPADPPRVAVTVERSGVCTAWQSTLPGAAAARMTQAELPTGQAVRLVHPTEPTGAAAVLFPGSEGGLDSQTGHARWLADRGILAAVCATVPEGEPILDTPLEAFCAAVEFVRSQPGVEPHRVVAAAISKGAEGLLAAAVRWDLQLAGLVLFSPSDRVWQAVGPDGPIARTSSWSVAGEPVPFARVDGNALMPQLLSRAWHAPADRQAGTVRPLRLLPAYPVADGVGQPLAAERVDCPILLISGDDDALWPASTMGRAIAVRRSRTDDVHLALPGVGHLITLGPGPVATRAGDIALGGNPDQIAASRAVVAATLAEFLCRSGVLTPQR